jgi:hypothetical protein
VGFGNFCRCFNKVTPIRGSCGTPLPVCGPDPERRRNPPSGHAIDPLGAAAASRQISEPRRRCRVAVSGIEESRGPRLVGKSDAYRRWRRYGFAWPSARCPPTRKNPLRSTAEGPFPRSRPRAPPTLTPSHAGPSGADRTRPVAPGAGTPPQTCGIVLGSSLWRQPAPRRLCSACMEVMPAEPPLLQFEMMREFGA